ncbi:MULTISPECIES: DUF7521 family protein [Halobacteria]|jgi:hypothetical protein|uniref:Uncharacterized protein n=1 Tax=Halorutilus salinus TaxID=2487751 RepID=A0A9Q4C661_9EURY|nr:MULTISPECIES: hypothetical protein [Halobacteria]MCX2819812.1 hypothetical protein [Halorutilus salinus]
MHIELVIAKLVTVGLGLLITYQAFRGYRVHGSEPMLYVAIGFLFISVGSVIEGILFDVVGLSIFVAGTIQTAIVAVGMLIILYSLYGRMSQPTDGGGDS